MTHIQDGGLNKSQNCAWLEKEDRRCITDVFQSKSACFSDLVKAAGLIPASDFRFADLSGVDFAESDIRGFDFTGSNLSKTRWFGATWDKTTILTDVELQDAQGYSDNEIRSQKQPEGRERSDEFRFLQNVPMAVATLNKSGRIERTNPLFERLYDDIVKSSGASTDDRSAIGIIAVNEWPKVEAMIASALDHNESIAPIEVQLAGKPDRSALLHISTVSYGNSRDEVAIVYLSETTEQRAIAAQLFQSEKMAAVGQLAAGIANDINNVLSAIMMATDFLLNAHKPTDPSFQDIMQIKQNANRAASLVRHLLAFSRRQTLRPQVLDLGDALSDVSMLLRRVIGENVTLDLVPGRDLWPVKADLSQLEHVIVNLAVNARDAMPKGGKLTVRTANVSESESRSLGYKGMPPADYVLVEVADSGTGIPSEIIDHIFEPFFTTKEVGKGTGLGLSTVYGFIKQTGGFIYPDSELGKGTTFRIFLPRHVPTAEEAGKAAPAPEAPAAKLAPADHTGQGTILLVEDEEGLRGLNARGLASRGYTVLEAGNGLEALKVIEGFGGAIDLIVSEVVMPEMDGPTLLKEMRRRNIGLKVIFVSGYAEHEFEKNLPVNGQFAFLGKPFTLKQLVATVKEVIGT